MLLADENMESMRFARLNGYNPSEVKSAMNKVNLRKLKISYAILGTLWSLVVLVSLYFNGNPTEAHILQRSVITHVTVWLSAFITIAHNYLQRFNRLVTGRELRMIELKVEVNELLNRLDEPSKYNTIVPHDSEGFVIAGELS